MSSWVAGTNAWSRANASSKISGPLIEALATGVPVVASAVGGVVGILEGGGGVSVPPEDPVVLADALVTLLTDRGQADAFSAQARHRAGDFALEKTVEAYERLLIPNTNSGSHQRPQ